MADEQPAQHEHRGDKPDCAAALAELYTYLDGEVTAETRALISAHLSGCNPCLEIFDFEEEFRIVVRTKCRDQVPESLRIKLERSFVELRSATLDPEQPLDQ